MAEYRQIEYRIGKDGKVIETVLSGSGSGCIDATAPIEQALGPIESRELSLDDYEGSEILLIDEIQVLQQQS